MRQIGSLLLFVTTLFIASCVFVSPDSISEVSARKNSGLGRTEMTVTLRRDGTAQCKCVFFWLREEPVAEPDTVCGRLLSLNRSAFTKIPETYNADEFSLEGVFNGKVSKERFEQMTKLIVENGYFSMKNEYLKSGALDAPPTVTRVVHKSGVKEISNQSDEGGKKLSEIEEAIFKAAEEIAWEKGGR